MPPRPGRPVEMTGKQRAQITAMACSTPPAGHGRWTLRLLADHCVELGYCEHLSHTHVKTILKKRIEAHLKKTWCISKVDASFLARMEALLWLYDQPYDPTFLWSALMNVLVFSSDKSLIPCP